MKRLVAALAFVPLQALAMDYGDFVVALQTEAGRETVRSYLEGFGRGVGMYDTRQAIDGRTRRFCQPQGLRFSPELLAGIVDKVVKVQPQLAKKDMPLDALIWTGLEAQFPCAKGKQG